MVEVREKVPTGHAGRWGGAVINQLVGRDVKLELGVYKLRKLRHPRMTDEGRTRRQRPTSKQNKNRGPEISEDTANGPISTA